MPLRPMDTAESAWRIVEEGLMKMSPAERVRRSIDLTIAVHRFALAQIRHQYPGETERQHKLRLAARYIDADIMRRAFNFVDDDRSQ